MRSKGRLDVFNRALNVIQGVSEGLVDRLEGIGDEIEGSWIANVTRCQGVFSTHGDSAHSRSNDFCVSFVKIL